MGIVNLFLLKIAILILWTVSNTFFVCAGAMASVREADVIQGQLIFKILENHFDECYLMKIRKGAATTFTHTVIKIPAVEVNYNRMNYKTIIDQLTESLKYSLVVKYSSQCIVYCLSLNGFNPDDIDDLLALFQIKALQVKATQSYILVSEFDNLEIGKAFLLSPKLKNFQHRMFLQTRFGKNTFTGFTLNRFCYFCSNGNPDVIQDYKNDVTQIKDVADIFPDMTRNFNGKIMRVIAPPAPPLVLIAPSKTQPGSNEIYGQHAIILKSLANHFNFSYILRSIPLTGVRLSNGTWNGIMGEILYNRADLGLSVATSYERYQIVDVTTAVFYAFLVLVSTKPKPTFKWQAIFYPFKMNCWTAFILSTVFTFVVSKWIHNVSIKYEIPMMMKGKNKYQIMCKLKAEMLTNYKSFYITVGHLLEQGTPFDFNTIPSRMFITFWMFFAIIITTAYRSKLFTFLTFPIIEVPPSTFLELSKSTFKWGMKHIGGIAFVFITKSPLAYVRNIGEKMQVYNDKYSCLDRTFRDRFTCIIYRAYIDYLMETRYWKIRHNFHISDFVSPPVGSSWVLPKYAPWLSAFDKASFPIYEMGLADKYLYDYQVSIAQILRRKAKEPNSTQDVFDLNIHFKNDDDNGPKPLVMANLYAAFFILIFGVSSSASLLAYELIRKNKYNKKLKAKRLKLKIHLLRKLKKEKKQLRKGKRLSFRQIAKIIRPNAGDILELEQRKNTVFSTVKILRNINHRSY